jgi:hypothetical protein
MLSKVIDVGSIDISSTLEGVEKMQEVRQRGGVYRNLIREMGETVAGSIMMTLYTPRDSVAEVLSSDAFVAEVVNMCSGCLANFARVVIV